MIRFSENIFAGIIWFSGYKPYNMTTEPARLSRFNKKYSLGIDIGSISINTIVIDQDGQVQLER